MAARDTNVRLQSLQQHLERIYAIAVDHDVDDFLITDPELARKIDNGEGAREIDEKLLIMQHGDCIDLALYLDSDLVTRLAGDDPTAYLHQGNLIDFCTALEGVSHFLYLTWNAALERSITCLEMEMQAEVDKYIAIATLLSEQGRKRVPAQLHRWLFDAPIFDAALDQVELERYRDANRYAGKYCLQLENRYLRAFDGGHSSMFEDLRQFYRLGLRDKIRRIELT